jgi:putative sigma-54 modulation protein
MTLDEAVLELEGSRDGVLVYRDASTERVRVLFRRRDGHLGLVEPEA